MQAPKLFGRRMNPFISPATRAWQIHSGPFEFRLFQFAGRELGEYRAVMLVAEALWEHRECRTLAQAVRSLTAMRNRLVRQLGDKK